MTLALDRRLAAVMFTDMVGYTTLVQADEDAAVTKRDQYWSVLEEQHDAFGGVSHRHDVAHRPPVHRGAPVPARPLGHSGHGIPIGM